MKSSTARNLLLSIGIFVIPSCAKPIEKPLATRPTTTTAPVAEMAEPEESLSNILQLTSGFEKAGEAYFSPDMNWIIFQATPKGETQYQMYVAKLKKTAGDIVGLDGTPIRISPKESRNTCGFFSPDGLSLIFASTAGKEVPDEPNAGYQREGGNYRWAFPEGMEIFRADDWEAGVHTAQADLSAQISKQPPGGQSHDSYATIDLAKKPITNNSAYDAEGAYSPDGKWIVFGSRRDGDSELYVMKADGSQPVRLTNAKGYDGGPFFSPDSKRILYRSDRKGNDLLQIFTADLVFDAAGDITGSANEKQLTDDANVNWGPYFHPDGHHIIFATSVHGHQNYELYVMRDDGTHHVRITKTPGFDGLPVFSPDGKYLMWSSKRSAEKTTQVFIAKFSPPADW